MIVRLLFAESTDNSDVLNVIGSFVFPAVRLLDEILASSSAVTLSVEPPAGGNPEGEIPLERILEESTVTLPPVKKMPSDETAPESDVSRMFATELPEIVSEEFPFKVKELEFVLYMLEF